MIYEFNENQTTLTIRFDGDREYVNELEIFEDRFGYDKKEYNLESISDDLYAFYRNDGEEFSQCDVIELEKKLYSIEMEQDEVEYDTEQDQNED